MVSSPNGLAAFLAPDRAPETAIVPADGVFDAVFMQDGVVAPLVELPEGLPDAVLSDQMVSSVFHARDTTILKAEVSLDLPFSGQLGTDNLGGEAPKIAADVGPVKDGKANVPSFDFARSTKPVQQAAPQMTAPSPEGGDATDSKLTIADGALKVPVASDPKLGHADEKPPMPDAPILAGRQETGVEPVPQRFGELRSAPAQPLHRSDPVQENIAKTTSAVGEDAPVRPEASRAATPLSVTKPVATSGLEVPVTRADQAASQSSPEQTSPRAEGTAKGKDPAVSLPVQTALVQSDKAVASPTLAKFEAPKTMPPVQMLASETPIFETPAARNAAPPKPDGSQIAPGELASAKPSEVQPQNSRPAQSPELLAKSVVTPDQPAKAREMSETLAQAPTIPKTTAQAVTLPQQWPQMVQTAGTSMTTSLDAKLIPDDALVQPAGPDLQSSTRVSPVAAPILAQGVAPTPVTVQIAQAIQSATSPEIDLRLNPEELGQVRIILTPRDSGMGVTILAERPETLDLMRRNADQLADDLGAMGYESTDFNFEQGTPREDPRPQMEFDAAQIGEIDSISQSPAQAVSVRKPDTDGLDIRF